MTPKLKSVPKASEYGAHFLDTSAFLKLLLPDLNEPGTENLLNFRRQRSLFFVYSFCLAETLARLKRGRKKSRSGYSLALNRLQNQLRHRSIRVIDTASFDEEKFEHTLELIERHNLDFVDAMQITEVLTGRFSRLRGKSRSLLITADKGLANAARSEGVQVWNCLKGAYDEVCA